MIQNAVKNLGFPSAHSISLTVPLKGSLTSLDRLTEMLDRQADSASGAQVQRTAHGSKIRLANPD